MHCYRRCGAKANRSDRKETSAQESIPYERMWPDGICRVAAQYYTKTIQFLDINYQLNQDEDKTAIFEGWGDFLNYFDSSIHFQLSFFNLPVGQEAVTQSLRVTLQGDEFDEIRKEYLSILKAQVSQGSRGLQKTKYLTFGIEAESIRTAKPRLDRIETDILGNFKREACRCDARRTNKGSCASRGAVFAAGRVNDLPIIIHGPASCGYVMSHTQDVHFLTEMGTNPDSVPKLRNNILSTRMTNDSSIFGGHRDLEMMIRAEAEKGKRTVMVVTTCVPGMIGDNLDLIKERMEKEYPGLNIMLVKADGNLTGGSEDGRMMAMREIIGLIDETQEPDRMEANLIDDNFILYGSGRNGEWTVRLLNDLGFAKVHKIFDDISLEEAINCKRNRLNVKVFDVETIQDMAEAMDAKGMSVFGLPLPKGYSQTLRWVEAVGKEYGIEEAAKTVMAKAERDYRAAIEKQRPFFEGKVVDIIAGIFSDDDWMIETLLDAGAEVRHLFILEMRMGAGGQRPRESRFSDRVETIVSGNPMEIRIAVEADDPDVVIGGAIIGWHGQQMKEFSRSYQCFTHYAAIEYLDYLHNLMVGSKEAGWRKWGGAEAAVPRGMPSEATKGMRGMGMGAGARPMVDKGVTP